MADLDALITRAVADAQASALQTLHDALADTFDDMKNGRRTLIEAGDVLDIVAAAAEHARSATA